MDNYPTSWAPQPGLVVATWLVTALLLVGAVVNVLTGDGSGLLLFALATVAVGAYAVHSSVARPRLAADAEGLRVRTFGGTHRLPWEGTRYRLRTTRRLGRDGVTLEIEYEDELYVLGRLDLGTDPHDVVEALDDLRARG
ncbi:PH domain-containing protein [Amycolatopsis sp. NPDC058986]|uniref:PH domain-containing protein n=1 Tax=unclassified Amycolatopsis TaxID=2618356 RepID=UPI003670074D